MKMQMMQAHLRRRKAVRTLLLHWRLTKDHVEQVLAEELVEQVLAYGDFDLGYLQPSLKWQHVLFDSGFDYTGEKYQWTNEYSFGKM